MGAFGFFPAAELAKVNGLNLGLQDIAASFKWVRKYIQNFGGNQRQVTGFGFSSGGIAITSLLLANDGKLDLFDRAFMQSGSFLPIMETPRTMRPIVNYLSQITKCNNTQMIACLRNMTAHDLNAASLETNTVFNSPLSSIWGKKVLTVGPIQDGNLINRAHFRSIELGKFRKVPIMINTNSDEAMFFLPELITKPSDFPSMKSRVFPWFSENEMARLDRYYPQEVDSAMLYHNFSAAV